jgi:hypothetical protein
MKIWQAANECLVRPERLSASRARQDAVLIFGQEAQSRKPNELASLKRADVIAPAARFRRKQCVMTVMVGRRIH